MSYQLFHIGDGVFFPKRIGQWIIKYIGHWASNGDTPKSKSVWRSEVEWLCIFSTALPPHLKQQVLQRIRCQRSENWICFVTVSGAITFGTFGMPCVPNKYGTMLEHIGTTKSLLNPIAPPAKYCNHTYMWWNQSIYSCGVCQNKTWFEIISTQMTWEQHFY